MTIKYVWNGFAQNDTGDVLGGATVTVRDQDTNALSTLYTDKDGGTESDNPFLVGDSGQIAFYASSGRYKITAAKDSDTVTFENVVIGVPDDALQTVDTLAELKLVEAVAGDKREYDGSVWKLTAGDFSSELAVDDYGFYVSAAGFASNEAAWVRQEAGRFQFKWFGAVPGQNVDDAFSRMLGLMYITRRVDADLGPAPESSPYIHTGLVIGQASSGSGPDLPVVLHGEGGHTSATVLECTAASGHGVRVACRSGGLTGVRVHGSSTRYAALSPSDNVMELLYARDDNPGAPSTPQGSISRSVCDDVYVTQCGSHGMNVVWNAELADWRGPITIQSCKGHPFTMDDGTTIGYVNNADRSFTVTLPKIRCFEAGGQMRIGVIGQTQIPRQITLHQPECLDIAQDKTVTGAANAFESYMLEIRAPNTRIIQPDSENQRYNDTTDQLGNSKAQITIPVRGIALRSTGAIVEMPYSSSLYAHGEIFADGCKVILPASFAGTYGIPATYGWICDVLAAKGFGFTGLTGENAGATQLVKNLSKTDDIEIDGVSHVGIAFTPYDWALPLDPVSRTVASGTLKTKEAYVSITGEGDATDSISQITMIDGSVSDGGRSGCFVRLVNDKAYDITLVHASGNPGEMFFKSGANVVLDGTGGGNNQREIVLNYNPTQNAWYEA